MAVFVSYSSRDRELLEGLTRALRQAHEQLWLDEQLEGGEAWWRTILEQIRACEVFIVALSQNSLESKPCLAELQYAQELGKPILPVQIGPDNMRVNPLAAIQSIDYRNPSIETSIELIADVNARRAKRRPLPDPLPDEPPMPFAYLMRLASTIGGPALSAQEQIALLAELRAGVDEDGDDVTARRDIIKLLCMLRDRADVTWRTRTAVEAVLGSLDSPPPASTAAPPRQPPQSNQQTVDAPPSPPSRRGLLGSGAGSSGTAGAPGRFRMKWVVAAGGVAVAAIAAVVMVLVLNGSRGHPNPPAAPTVATSALASFLLTAEEIHSIMGTTNLTPNDVVSHMDDYPWPTSHPVCAWLVNGTAIRPLYERSGYSGVADQAFTTDPPDVWLSQTAVAFPSVDQARAFVSTSADKWKGCAGQTVTVNLNGMTERWTPRELTRDDSQISQLSMREGPDGYGCQHVLRSVSNAVIEVATCGTDITDQASRITDKMAAKATA